MTAAEFNAAHPVGSRVIARLDDGRHVYTATRTPAWDLGHGAPVVAVHGHVGGIALTHIDVTGGAS